jgi:hypothetical protein
LSLKLFSCVYLLHAGEDLPSSDNANQGCQWDVQTYEG